MGCRCTGGKRGSAPALPLFPQGNEKNFLGIFVGMRQKWG